MEAKDADICLLLEGTYPYVAGGVSGWVDQIIRGLPDFTFALVYLGSQKKLHGKPHYELPDNVTSLTEIFLYDRLREKDLRPGRVPPAAGNRFYEAVYQFYAASGDEDRIGKFWETLEALEALGPAYTFGNLCKDTASWETQLKLYHQFAPNESFIDFFWTTRFLHLPIWRVLQYRRSMPEAAVYHSVTTGYSGLLGAIAARRTGRPYVITEHGIYNNERLAEISRADWIYEAQNVFFSYAEGLSKFKQIWIGFFFFLARLAYQSSDLIISLFEGNARIQIEYGAPEEKMRILPNGIHPDKFDEVRNRRLARLSEEGRQPCVGFIGRVVSIKDVKTLLRAMRIVAQRRPDARLWVVGPNNEDPIYYEECRNLVNELRLSSHVEFLGNQNIQNILPEIDLLVLTSVSEGLPLVILEAFAAGIPAVSTDVGACRELICGRTEDDRALGPAGIVTRVSAPMETANALESLLNDRKLLLRMGEAGRKRVERFYRQQDLLDHYHEIYARLTQSSAKAMAAAH